jgi:hypothetical protein
VSDLPEGLHALDLDEDALAELRPWAELFDRMGRQVPSPTPYTATDFVEWLLLERRARASDQVTERRRDDRQIRTMNRAAAF